MRHGLVHDVKPDLASFGKHGIPGQSGSIKPYTCVRYKSFSPTVYDCMERNMKNKAISDEIGDVGCECEGARLLRAGRIGRRVIMSVKDTSVAQSRTGDRD
jgi:hypothetical protein